MQPLLRLLWDGCRLLRRPVYVPSGLSIGQAGTFHGFDLLTSNSLGFIFLLDFVCNQRLLASGMTVAAGYIDE
jgi:hypothetical protein